LAPTVTVRVADRHDDPVRDRPAEVVAHVEGLVVGGVHDDVVPAADVHLLGAGGVLEDHLVRLPAAWRRM
jgi:hypothetical protein